MKVTHKASSRINEKISDSDTCNDNINKGDVTGSDYLKRLIYRVAMKGYLEEIKLWLNLESREGDNQEKTWH